MLESLHIVVEHGGGLSFALVLDLYLFRAWWWFYFEEIDEFSCFTYIILRVLNSMVICLNNPNMLGIQE